LRRHSVEKTNSPLNIVVTSELYETPEVKELIAHGHHVAVLGENPFPYPERIDLVLGDSCWYMNKELLKYLDIALKSARKRKKGAQDAQNPKETPVRRDKIHKIRAS